MKFSTFLLLSCLLSSACAPSTPPTTVPLVNVYASSAAYPWLSGMYDCASPSAAINLTNPQSADINLRLGLPAILNGPTYQIGTEDLLVVANPGSGMDSLALGQVQSVFSGRILNWKELGGVDLPLEVWTYSHDTDIEGIFDHGVMNGEPITSLARLAVSVQSMSVAIGGAPGSVGILPRRQKTGAVQEEFALSALPILAITKSEPQGVIKDLLACEQAGK